MLTLKGKEIEARKRTRLGTVTYACLRLTISCYKKGMGADKALVSTALFTPATIHRFTIILQTVLGGFFSRIRKNLVFDYSKEKADRNIGFIMFKQSIKAPYMRL